MLTPIIESLHSKIFHRHFSDTILAEQEHFCVKMASQPSEILAAQQLRYRVFKQEQGRLKNCESFIDNDHYDRYCRHLIVTEKSSGKIVGTYRVLNNRAATLAGSFYSEEEFAIDGLEAIRHEVCEVGRSCVDPEFRNGSVMGLLWGGLINLRKHPRARHPWLHHYARRRRPPAPAFQYLFGCVSMEDSNPVAAMALYEYLRNHNLVSDKLVAIPCPGFELEPVSPQAVAQYLERHEKMMMRTLPPLFKGYLNLGAKICGPPAYDRDFGTIDFLILEDMREMPERYVRHFTGGI